MNNRIEQGVHVMFVETVSGKKVTSLPVFSSNQSLDLYLPKSLGPWQETGKKIGNIWPFKIYCTVTQYNKLAFSKGSP